MKKNLLGALLLLSAHATANTSNINNYNPYRLNAGLSVGALGAGQGTSLVWNNNAKISQLDWKIETTPIVQVDLQFKLRPQTRINAKLWHSITKSQSEMYDQDWANANDPNQITHRSWHPDTDLKSAYLADINLSFDLLDNQGQRLSLLTGLQQQQLSWQAKGGRYQYPQSSGSFAEGLAVVDYKQTLLTPYLGVQGCYRINRFELSAYAKYSAWVKGKEYDLHHLRNIVFQSNTRGSQYHGLGLGVSYAVRSNWQIFTGIEWHKYSTAKTKIIKDSHGNDLGRNGLNNQHRTYTVGLKFKF